MRPFKSSPSLDLSRFFSSSRSRIWSWTVTGRRGFWWMISSNEERETSECLHSSASADAHVWPGNWWSSKRTFSVCFITKRTTRTWSAVMPFIKAFLTLSLVIMPTIRFGKRYLSDTKRFKTAVCKGLSGISPIAVNDGWTLKNHTYLCRHIFDNLFREQ